MSQIKHTEFGSIFTIVEHRIDLTPKCGWCKAEICEDIQCMLADKEQCPIARLKSDFDMDDAIKNRVYI